MALIASNKCTPIPPIHRRLITNKLRSCPSRMFNRQKLSTNKFATAIRATFVPTTPHINDISKEDLELLFDSQQQEGESHEHGGDSRLPSDVDIRSISFDNAPTKDAVYEQQQCNQQYPIQSHSIEHQAHLEADDNTIELVKRRTGFDETAFRSQLAFLHTSTQSAFKADVDSLYDLIDAHVDKVSQSLLIVQRNVLQEAEELIREIRKNVLEVEEMEGELEEFMGAVQAAYERAFPRFRIKD